eukprot:758184-Hanusia_phi.AAC.16
MPVVLVNSLSEYEEADRAWRRDVKAEADVKQKLAEERRAEEKRIRRKDDETTRANQQRQGYGELIRMSAIKSIECLRRSK